MSGTNPYCSTLNIRPPTLESVRHHPEATCYNMLLVALLERGAPMTLAEVAERLEAAGVAPAAAALASLKRCKPGRAPIYRDGDLYALDPHDDDASLRVFCLGLRPPRAPALRVARPEPYPLPSSDEPLRPPHITDAWESGIPWNWSVQRIVICILDTHDEPQEPAAVQTLARLLGDGDRVTPAAADRWRSGSPIRVTADGRWELDAAHPAVVSARLAVIDRIAMIRRRRSLLPDPEVQQANFKRFERESAENAAQLAAMRRVILHAFPAAKPEALVLLDVERREIVTLLGDKLADAKSMLHDYGIIAAVDVRTLLRRLEFDPGERRLGELGPPQKTMQINRQGRTLRITLDLLVQGSCNLGRPFGDADTLRGYLQRGETTKLRRRLESDAKSLFALYQYGRLHGTVRLRWGFLDEWLPVPWVHRDEPRLHQLMSQAHTLGRQLEVVAGGAPGWSDPWARARLAQVHADASGWHTWLVDEHGFEIEEREVQLARLAAQETTGR